MSDSHTPRLIVGAGLAGLIAAHAWPSALVVEAAPQPRESHRALLRFRSNSVAQLTGIDFRRVRVRKGIWSFGNFVEPNIQLANKYAAKVNGHLRGGDRSIWNLDPVDRFIAPDDFYAQLLEAVGPRISWNSPVDFGKSASRTPVVSTAPMHVVLDSLGYHHGLEFRRAPIFVARYNVPDADLYQTVYFPDVSTALYRASFTGSTLILELAGNPTPRMVADARLTALEAFGMTGWDCEEVEQVSQRYGKISPLPSDEDRKMLIHALSSTHRIYSLGRFATWRNILLDDVVDDIAVLRRLMRGDAYSSRLAT